MSEHIHHLPQIHIEDILAEDVLDAAQEAVYQRRWEEFQTRFPELANEVLKRGFMASEQHLDPQSAMTRLGSYIMAVLERAAQRENSEITLASSASGDGDAAPQP